MTFGPACERCGGNSYEPSSEGNNPKCPWCKKPKRRGSRQELVDALFTAKHTLIESSNYVSGVSGMNARRIKERIQEVIQIIEDV